MTTVFRLALAAAAMAHVLAFTVTSAKAERDDAEVTGSVERGARSGGVEQATLKRLIDLYTDGNITNGDAGAAGVADPAARALLEWVAIRHNGKALGFERLSAFLKSNPAWPTAAFTRRRAEEALFAEDKSPAVVHAFFAPQKPVGAAGKVALALVLKGEGSDKDALALVRSAWREDGLGKDVEDAIIGQFKGALSRADHRYRMERLLFRNEWDAAIRAAGQAGSDYVALAKARVAVGRKAGNAAALVAAVPESVRGDTSYLYARALLLRRADKPAEAARIIANVPRDRAIVVDGDEWWVERRLIARKLLDEGDARGAYRVVNDHAAETPPRKIEAEFHAGWIALRFLKDPGLAARHFATAAAVAETPISVGRVAYWQGRAAEAANETAAARQHYERAAAQSITYYGQLARAKLGLRDLPLRRPQQTSTAAFERSDVYRAIRMLYEAGERELAIPLFTDLAQKLTDPGQIDALADLAATYRDARAMVLIGKAATQRGQPLDLAAFPTIGMPAFEPVGEPVEKPMIFAIARQESVFDSRALSSAGARGLMQLMPATARRTATRAGIGFDAARLTSDAAYNARVGATHLRELVDEWRGSYILTFAAYNAGGSNVKKWIAAYGDPRSASVDPVDWVERIPFSETRNYVQRVLENVQVYRQRLGERTAMVIDQDLRRGGADE